MNQYCYFNSPIGKLLLLGKDNTLEELHFPNSVKENEPEDTSCFDENSFSEVKQQLQEYFSGKRATFSLKLAPQGTDFQKNVWKALLNIPYGETTNYGEIARQVGSPKGSRAVGLANGKNPIPIIVPCHRVIGKDGSLTGFGGGLKIKKQLLDLEKNSNPG